MGASKERLHVVVTDYSVVSINQKWVDMFEAIDPDWLKFSTSKRYRSKRAIAVRNLVREFESAVSAASKVAFCAGKDLTEF